MNNKICTRNFIIIIIISIIFCIFISNYYNRISLKFLSNNKIIFKDHLIIDEHNDGWISDKVYKQFQLYIKKRNKDISHIKKPIRIENNEIKTLNLNNNYIKFLKKISTKNFYPYSKWECSNTSNTDDNAKEYCILSNIYYNSDIDQYYFYQDPLLINKIKQRTIFMAPYHAIQLNIINHTNFFEKFHISAILTQPILVAAPPDDNYAHGFLELLGPRFWVLAECQYHSLYINPNKIQIYYTSKLLADHVANWGNYKRKSDGTYEPIRHWEKMIQSMLSIYPLLTYASFNKTNILFKYMIFPGQKMSRSASFGYSYPSRKYRSSPLSTQHYRRAYLAYSEWILFNFNLLSKFQLTSIQKELQEKKLSEKIPICNEKCSILQHKNISIDDEYTGEWIIVLNRIGSNRREITNANQLVNALLKVFPDHSNPYLRVWPKEFNFHGNFYENVRIARSTRLIIGVHGAGLSNTIFMRPGAILLEINPYGCRELSFNFRRWAEVFNLQHALWIPSYGENGNQDDICNRDGRITLNVPEIIDEVKNLLKNEIEYRNGYLKRALNIMNDLSIADYPPKGYEHILS